MDKRIAIGSDHAGWDLKERVKKYLLGKGYEVVDSSARTKEPVDYPDIGHKVAGEVSAGRTERGVLICGTGIGMSLAANKHPHVRAALCHNVYTARMSRQHNDSNILIMGGRVIGEGLALEMLECWLNTSFEEGRHLRRINKIDLEK